ncbi:MAG: MAE_28990/MAE_18760 family HEPN-like nuclease [Bryobacteraceae bacterium]|nr:MAE_28990/MAE_18760 family HEPN-like nuclease [Bryobacteraceae bacterium]
MSDTLTQTFEERLQEIDAYLELLEALEKQLQEGPPVIGGVRITAQQQKLLYSSVFLQLYNLVEATVTWCVSAVCDAACDKGQWAPADFSSKLRREWVRSTARTHVDLNEENRLESAVELCEFLIQANPVVKFTVARRGNWDELEIEAITQRLGFDLNISAGALKGIKRHIRDEKGALALIRDLRNRLGHGSLSFSECGEGYTVPDLRDLKERTAQYLREVVAAFRAYIDSYEFLLPARRP